MKKRLALITAICMTAILLLAGCDNETVVVDTSPTGLVPSVRPDARTMTVERMDLKYEAYMSGAMVSIKQINLIFKDTSGPLAARNVTLYDRVSAGQVIAEIDAAELERDLQKADLQKQIYELQKEAYALSAQALQVSINQAASELKQIRDAYNANPVQANKYLRDRLQAEYDQLLLSQKTAGINRQIADINYEDFLLNYAKIEARLTNRIMKAPKDGIITAIDPIEIGDILPAGRYLYKYTPLNQLAFKISSLNAVNLHNQDEITVKVGDTEYRAYSYTAVAGDDIFKIDDIGNKGIAYLAFYDKVPEVAMEKAQSIHVLVEKKNALYISKKCLRNTGGVITANIKTDDGFEQVIVTCGIEVGDNMEILSGLSEGDVVAMDSY